MFERFTVPARETVVRARNEALALRAPLIGTEHLLLALLDPDATTAYPVLTGAGVTHQRVRDEIERRTSRAGALGAEDAEALRSIGIDLDAVLASIAESFGPDALAPPAPKPGRGSRGRTSSARRFTPNARKTMGLAVREAVRLADKHIDDGHILLGLVRGGGLGATILTDLGVPPAGVRTALEQRRRRAA